MAEDVQVQSDVTITGSAKARTLHLKTLRKQWQIITLQIIATAALIGMYLEVVSTYVVGTIDHTILFSSIESLIGDEFTIRRLVYWRRKNWSIAVLCSISYWANSWRPDGASSISNTKDPTKVETRLHHNPNHFTCWKTNPWLADWNDFLLRHSITRRR